MTQERNTPLHLKFEGQPTEHEVIVRHGDAEKLHEYKPMSLSGRFGAPAEFVNKRYNQDTGLLDKYTVAECHVVFNTQTLSITLVAGEQERDTITISGHLKKDPFLESLQINGRAHTNKSLLELIRFKGHLFANREEHKQLVLGLQKFEVKTSTETRDVNDRQGTKEAVNSIKASNELSGQRYQLNVPLFEGHAKGIVDLTIEIEPSNGSVAIYLVSETFDEYWDKAVEAEFDVYEDTFAPFVIIRKN